MKEAAIQPHRPVLLLYYHMDKCGGSTVRAWLRRHPSVDTFYSHERALALFAEHADLFGEANSSWSPSDWQRSTLAVEFHDRSLHLFFTRLLPQLPALRQRYASVGGRLVSLITVREPAAQLVSIYRMWPPMRLDRAGNPIRGAALPLEEWLPHVTGVLSRCLVPETSCFEGRRGWACEGLSLRPPIFVGTAWRPPVWSPRCPPGELLRLARERLASFDVVIDSSALTAGLANLSSSLGWRPLRVPVITPSVQSRDEELIRRNRELSSPEALSNLSIRTALAHATRCDAQLWGVARALSSPPVV